eukprot:15295670-Alexandrium_andersonii.AAC.1
MPQPDSSMQPQASSTHTQSHSSVHAAAHRHACKDRLQAAPGQDPPPGLASCMLEGPTAGPHQTSCQASSQRQ